MNNSYAIDTGSLYMDDMVMESETTATTEISMDGLLSNWFFVGGVTGGMFIFSILIGLLAAKSKIKKGFDVYED
ncbi:MAG: hypothetical protein J6K04_09590 [Lachnospiraceae bacterium]|nr:hypothetical protein [Lachnospiraceae bacterium]